MAYTAPYVDEAGLHISSYADIRDDLIAEMRKIYGQDIYLDNDSQDYQLISAFALKAYDVQQSLLLAYNNSSPVTAIGTGLDRIVAINGIKRDKATYSTCVVKLTGQTGTVINNGVIKDQRGLSWTLPAKVTIGIGGTVQATATCATAGQITANPGDIDGILTPTKGWTAVINEASAIPGQNQETDRALRSKQAVSTANPSKSVFDGLTGAIANCPGVIRYKTYENDTSATAGGLPPHSVTVVVEGGDNEALAKLIFLHKTPGCYTNGNIAVEVAGAYNTANTMRFYRPGFVDLAVSVTVHPLTGYTDATTGQIKDDIYQYINGLDIGASIYTPNLNAPVLSALGSPPSFYVEALTAKVVGQTAAEVIDLSLIQAARISLANITVEVNS